MKYIAKKIFICVFALFLIVIPLLSFIFPEKEFSLFEFRFISATPEYSAERLLDTKYYNEWEKYFSDRIFGRTKWLSLYTKLNIYCFKKPVVNDIVINNGTLLPAIDFSEPDFKFIDEKIDIFMKNIKKLNNLSDDIGAKLYFVGVPEQSSMLAENYPDYMKTSNSKEYIEEKLFSSLLKENIETINMYDIFKNMNYTDLYSKTDHHYNYFGAFETYREIVKRISSTSDFDITTLDYDDMNFEMINLPFYGSRSRKLFGEFSDTESIFIGYPKNEINFTRLDEGKDEISGVFDLPRENYSTYNVYMGGDKSETIIKTNRESKPDLLLIGDSFTNPLETLLYYHCDEFRSLDFRYYIDSSLTDYLKEYKPDIIIFLRDDSNYLNTDGNGNMNFYMDNT